MPSYPTRIGPQIHASTSHWIPANEDFFVAIHEWSVAARPLLIPMTTHIFEYFLRAFETCDYGESWVLAPAERDRRPPVLNGRIISPLNPQAREACRLSIWILTSYRNQSKLIDAQCRVAQRFSNDLRMCLEPLSASVVGNRES